MWALVSQLMFVGVDEEENGVSSMQIQTTLLPVIVSWTFTFDCIGLFELD